MDQEIKEIIQEAEKLAESASEKFQQSAFRELMKYFLENGKSKDITFSKNKSEDLSTKDTPPVKQVDKDIPEDYLIAEQGELKHFVAWAVLVLSNEGVEATVKKVREKIDLSLSVSKPGRTYTSGKLADLCPKYMKREKVTEGRGYKYVPTDKITEVFEDLAE